MAAITPTNGAQVGAFSVTETTLTSSDTLTFAPAQKQLLVLRNDTGGSLTATIDGDAGTTVAVDGLGSVSVASGLAIAVPAGQIRAVVLSTIRHYLAGNVAVTGGTGLKAQLHNL